MRSACLLIRRFRSPRPLSIQRRSLLTLAIETSCDDTSVAVLEKNKNQSALLHFNRKITADNRSSRGIHPIPTHESHQKNLAILVNEALQSLPLGGEAPSRRHRTFVVQESTGEKIIRTKPDFITVTRGPGMRASLITGMDTAKGLAVAWQVPLVAVHHMQAHALTPRLVAALRPRKSGPEFRVKTDPRFPFLTLLVSGGHTMLVHSKELCDHEILANTDDIAIGDFLDKCARDILPPSLLASAPDVMYGPILEKFVFPDDEPNYDEHPDDGQGPLSVRKAPVALEAMYGWRFTPPYGKSGPKGQYSYPNLFSYSGLGSMVKQTIEQKPEMGEVERRWLAHEAMRVAFEHLFSRVLVALQRPEIAKIQAIVVSGGVASNQYLKHIFRKALNENDFSHIKLVFPPPKFCTDNAAMIAWTGIEMFEAGWETDLSAMATRHWAVDPKAEDGGILGIGGWNMVPNGRAFQRWRRERDLKRLNEPIS